MCVAGIHAAVNVRFIRATCSLAYTHTHAPHTHTKTGGPTNVRSRIYNFARPISPVVVSSAQGGINQPAEQPNHPLVSLPHVCQRVRARSPCASSMWAHKGEDDDDDDADDVGDGDDGDDSERLTVQVRVRMNGGGGG